MQRDQYQHVSNFLDDAGFREWVLTGTDNENWADWEEKAPNQSQLVHEARIFLLAVGGQDAPPDHAGTEAALADTWSQIHDTAKRPFIKNSAFWWKCAAAIVLFALGISWQLSSSESKNRRAASDPVAGLVNRTNIRVFNQTDSPKTINLDDGSSVILQPGGLLSHPAVFGPSTRDVYLSGEAFFEISKNREKPFLVYTSDIVTRVVGTSFTIKAIEDQPNVEVFVKTGEVNVRQLKTENANVAPKEIALIQNESASFVKAVSTFEKAVARGPSKRPAEYLTFEFTDTPVAEIFRSIEAAYGLSIEFPEKLLEECYLSTSLSDEPLLGKLKIICESLGGDARFTVTDAQSILVESKGCNN